MSQPERMAVFHKVKEDKDHEDIMRPSVNTHLHYLAQGVNDDLAQDAHTKRQLQKRQVQDLIYLTSSSMPATTVTSAAVPSDPAPAATVSGSTTASGTPAPTFTSETDVLFDTARPISTTIMGYKLCEAFKQLQIQAAATINDPKGKVSVATLPLLMSNKLPKEYFAWVQQNEDTFAHGAVDIILKHFFPENTPTPYELNWANRSASGSKARRGDPLKPDATVAYVETKAPKDSRYQSRFVEGMWSLTSEARDQIDFHLRNQRSITVVPCIYVFGYKVKLFKMGSCWTTSTSNLTLRTPPYQLPDELLPDNARPQPVNVTPSKRPFFADHRRSSVSAGLARDK
ncbi:hypothetical protein BGZ95_001573 [Linnemannia exigua]|uniref:Uncharacterized protein n=1 Tax=Linnemannia exigua TaxID=604196 RepID=A0AAD4H8Q4_9FUNG|nr:hypothetical protein BGZ95_001573 [Linnemannia exigua]